VLVAPAYPSESTLPRTISTASHTYDAETLSKTRVWGSNEKILLHFRATLLRSGEQRWGCAECSWKNAVGSVVTYDYDAFGVLIHSTGTTPNNYLFAGEQFDPDLNLYYNRARYLNTSTGRFWSMDSHDGNDEEPLSLHKYLYAGADSVNESDPSGHDFGIVDALIVAVPITVLAAIPTAVDPGISKAKVLVHFDLLGSAGSSWHHAYITVQGPGVETPIVFRGGPSDPGCSDQGSNAAANDLFSSMDSTIDLKCGYLTKKGTGGLWVPGGADYPRGPNDNVATMTVLSVNRSAGDLIGGFEADAWHIEDLHLRYRPISQNSNSFVHTLLVKENLISPSPPVWVPGWDNILY